MMRVRLLQDLSVSQKKGDVVEVAEGYARTYLVANNFAERVEEEKHNDWDPKAMSDAESLDVALVLEEFRRQMYNGGLRKWSINGLNRVFDSVTRGQSGDSEEAVLDKRQFTEAINKFGVFLNERATATLFRSFDKTMDDAIQYKEFLAGLRGPMNERRFVIVERAWQKVLRGQDPDSEEGGAISADAMHDRFINSTEHPLVRSGQASIEAVEAATSRGMEKWAAQDGLVDEAAFVSHFTDVSAAIDSDDIFVAMVERQFGVREKPVSDETRATVQRFRQELLDKLHQKAWDGTSQARTLLRAFQLVNADSMGAISLGDFSACLANFGFRGAVVQEVFQFFDQSQDNTISYEEFAAVILAGVQRQ